MLTQLSCPTYVTFLNEIIIETKQRLVDYMELGTGVGRRGSVFMKGQLEGVSAGERLSLSLADVWAH